MSDRLVNLRIRDKVYKSLRMVSAIIYPPQCLLCDAPGQQYRDLCVGCEADLPWNRHACPQCALPLPVEAAGQLCGQCLSAPPPFEQALSALRYSSVSSWLIAGLKFRGQLSHARLLGDLLTQQILASGQPLPERIIPVPLHASRLRQRGYNQALELARPVARNLGIKMDLSTVKRSRATNAQSDLQLKDRRRNIRGAFSATQALEGAHVAIVDDVVTSTATVRELADTLRKAGAGAITVWSPTRAPRSGDT